MKTLLRKLFMPVENSRLKTNLVFALSAQTVSLSASVLMSLLIPRVLGVEQYGYWQLFLLYASYVGIATLGINDGLYLRIGGSRYSELEFASLNAQYRLYVAIQSIIFGLALALLLVFSDDENRRFVAICVVVFGIVANLFSWLSYLMQGTNLTHLYSFAVMGNKVLFILLFFVGYFWGPERFQFFVFVYLACQLIALAYLLLCARAVLSARGGSLRIGIRVVHRDLRAGIKIMIAYHAAALILGFSRLIVDANWGIVEFGYYSFAISITAFVLMFLGQISLVLFPVLKRLGQEARETTFVQLRDFLYTLLPVAYVAYLPMVTFLDWWLPDYAASLTFLGLVLPVAVFDSKTNLLGTTFFKVFRDERALLVINLVSLAVSVALTLIAVYWVADLRAVCLAIVIAVVFRTFLCELFLRHFRMRFRFWGPFFLEFSLAMFFVIAVIFDVLAIWAAFFLFFLGYLLCRRGSLRNTWSLIRRQFSRS